MLLGQGDFIQHLLELIGTDLNKPTHSIARPTLLGILESAIRSSNAQYDDPDVLARLDIRLSSEVELSDGQSNQVLIMCYRSIHSILDFSSEQHWLGNIFYLLFCYTTT
jgi:hypothetical protein